MQNITLVIPVFNESAGVAESLETILAVLEKIENISFSLLFVDDGSTDDTAQKIQIFREKHNNIELLCLNRNFGKEAAIHAGLDHVDSDAAIVIDSDLQHPPALIPQMVRLWQNGVDVVEASKSNRGQESLAARLLASGFYRTFDLLVGMDIKGHTDFKLLDRRVIDAWRALPERKRFFRGLVAWMGFSSADLYFDVPPRVAGKSAWSRFKLFRFALTALISFTPAPLYLITLLGAACLFLSIVFGGIALYDKLTGVAVTGFTTVILLILLIGSFIMIGIGLIGVYIEQIFAEIKNRPTYLVDERRSLLNRNPLSDEQ